MSRKQSFKQNVNGTLKEMLVIHGSMCQQTRTVNFNTNKSILKKIKDLRSVFISYLSIYFMYK